MVEDAMADLMYHGQIQMYTLVACMALMVYDHLHTLPMEVEHMWSQRLSTVNVLYYIAKYGIFFSAINLYRFFYRTITAQECRYMAYTYSLNLFTLWAGEAVLGIRIWAIWEKKRSLSIGLPIVFLFLSVTNIVFAINYIDSLEYGLSPAPQLISCFVTNANKSIYVVLACLPAWVTLKFILLTISAYFAYKSGSNTRFVRMIYREGITYYFYLLLLHTVSLVIYYKAPPTIASNLPTPVCFLHVALASRVILHIRKQAHKGVLPIDQDTVPEIWWTET